MHVFICMCVVIVDFFLCSAYPSPLTLGGVCIYPCLCLCRCACLCLCLCLGLCAYPSPLTLGGVCLCPCLCLCCCACLCLCLCLGLCLCIYVSLSVSMSVSVSVSICVYKRCGREWVCRKVGGWVSCTWIVCVYLRACGCCGCVLGSEMKKGGKYSRESITGLF